MIKFQSGEFFVINKTRRDVKVPHVMKMKTFALSMLLGSSLIAPSWAEPAVSFIQNSPAKEVAEPSELLAKLGFAAHVPKDTEGYFSLMGAYDLYERLQETDLGQLMNQMMEAQGVSPSDLEETEEFSIFKAVVGEELFMAFGKGAGGQAVHLNAINSSYNYHIMKMVVKMVEIGLSAEPDFEAMEGLMKGLVTDMVADPKAGMESFKKAKMPPVTVGFKVSDEDMRNQIFEMMNAGVAMIAEDVDFPGDEIDVEKDSVQVTGVTISGKKMAALGRAELDDDVVEAFGSEAKVEEFLKALEEKNLNIALALKGSYIVAYLGDSLDGLSFPAKPEDSLLANPGMDFMTNYADKDVRMLLFGNGEALQTMTGGTDIIGSAAKGLKAGLSASDFFGDTRDVQALLGHVARLEKSMVEMIDYSRLGGVGFLEDGFKIEVHGGSNQPMVDTKTPHTFSALGEMDDVVFFSNSRSNPEFSSKLYDLLSSFGEAAYLMASRASELNADDPELREFGEGFKMFEQTVAKDLRSIWDALTVDWAEGTGNESAVIIDTKGTMPTVPEVPDAIIEKGLIPRIAYVTPVTDRAKVSTSWEKIEGGIKNLLKTMKEMDGPAIPMQAIDDKTEDGVTYYTTQIQFSTPDARPVIGLSDKHFYFATSPKFIGELNKAMGEKGPARSGNYTRVNFSAANEMAKYWVELLKDNAEEIFENEFQRDDFLENLPMVEKVLAAFGQFEEFTSHVREEGGETRTSVHFKMN